MHLRPRPKATSMRYFLLLALPCLLLAPACNKKVGTAGVPGRSVASKASKVMKGLEDNAFTAQFMEGKARVKLASEKYNVGGTATIRLERDKAIWMSVKKFGIEGARAWIRPDSFFVYNRLNGDYTAEPLSYIEEKYKIPARFDLLQEIVLGNAVFFSRDLELDEEGETYILDGRDTRYATNYRVDSRGFKLQTMQLTELAQNRKLRIDNADFRPVESAGKTDFAYGRTVSIEAAATGPAKLELAFTKLNFDGPFAMPFRRR